MHVPQDATWTDDDNFMLEMSYTSASVTRMSRGWLFLSFRPALSTDRAEICQYKTWV